jgi:hypothetical protein
MAWNTPSTVTFGAKATSAKWNEIVNDLKYLKGQAGFIELEEGIRFGLLKLKMFRVTGLVASPQTLIADGADDVTEACWIAGALTDGTNAFVTTAQSLRPNTLNVPWYTDGGSNIVQLNVINTGQVTIVRGAGSRTYTAHLLIMWH